MFSAGLGFLDGWFWAGLRVLPAGFNFLWGWYNIVFVSWGCCWAVGWVSLGLLACCVWVVLGVSVRFLGVRVSSCGACFGAVWVTIRLFWFAGGFACDLGALWCWRGVVAVLGVSAW